MLIKHNTGNLAALSFISAPALIRSREQDNVSSQTLARQWKYTLEAGVALNPPVAAASTFLFGYLAWSVRTGTSMSLLLSKNSTRLYSLAAVLTIGIVPYTISVMSTTNNRLLAMADQGSGSGDAGEPAKIKDNEVVELLTRWKYLNAIRSLLPLIGGAAAFGAILQ